MTAVCEAVQQVHHTVYYGYAAEHMGHDVAYTDMALTRSASPIWDFQNSLKC